ncbi:MAG TPA: metallophosphoesterase [Vicinamibacterales bacterium]|nr:metallophosphoesterase [Vicinamibacterales bacterium]
MKTRNLQFIVVLWASLGIAAVVQGLTGQQRVQAPQAAMSANVDVSPPIGKDSVRFLVVGDSGTGDRAQHEVAAQMWKAHAVFPYEFAIMLGDNMYGSERPQDYAKKFEIPFKPLLDAKIPFYAALGNHDDPNQRFYKNFNMGGKRFYTYTKKDTRFFALDSNYMDKDQQRWLEEELSRAKETWKIAYFHHPIYSSGGRHGSEVDLRAIIEPFFIKYALNVVFAGHEHFYERIKPQKGIYHFTAGGSAKLRSGDIRATTGLTAKGFDTEQSFMLVEIDGDVLRFQTITRRGKRVDSGEIRRGATS